MRRTRLGNKIVLGLFVVVVLGIVCLNHYDRSRDMREVESFITGIPGFGDQFEAISFGQDSANIILETTLIRNIGGRGHFTNTHYRVVLQSYDMAPIRKALVDRAKGFPAEVYLSPIWKDEKVNDLRPMSGNEFILVEVQTTRDFRWYEPDLIFY